MNYKKPTLNIDNKQLFAIDVNNKGAKKWIFDSYHDIYQTISHNKINNFYEDTTFATSIKLHIVSFYC